MDDQVLADLFGLAMAPLVHEESTTEHHSDLPRFRYGLSKFQELVSLSALRMKSVVKALESPEDTTSAAGLMLLNTLFLRLQRFISQLGREIDHITDAKLAACADVLASLEKRSMDGTLGVSPDLRGLLNLEGSGGWMIFRIRKQVAFCEDSTCRSESVESGESTIEDRRVSTFSQSPAAGGVCLPQNVLLPLENSYQHDSHPRKCALVNPRAVEEIADQAADAHWADPARHSERSERIRGRR